MRGAGALARGGRTFVARFGTPRVALDRFPRAATFDFARPVVGLTARRTARLGGVERLRLGAGALFRFAVVGPAERLWGRLATGFARFLAFAVRPDALRFAMNESFLALTVFR